MKTKYRVLCLHGYRQNAIKLRGRIAALRRAFKASVEFVCINGPILVPYEPTNEEHAKNVTEQQQDTEEDRHQFSWWNYHIDEQTGAHKYSNVMESIEYISKVCAEDGPFDGIFGFSQGGMMASMILQLQDQKKEQYQHFNFHFAIFVASGASKDPSFLWSDKELVLPSLHVMGETDAVVNIERSRHLLEYYKNPQVFVHPGGHYIPTAKEAKDAMRLFFQSFLK